jgi:hypothetical protein
MKNLSHQVFLSLVLALSLIFTNAHCQINIIPKPTVTLEEMVENLVGEGINYSNVTFTGANISSGIFNNAQTTDLGIESGVFLTSGAGYIIPGPNNDYEAGSYNGTLGDLDLNFISNYITHDAAVLQFDFIPESDTIRFQYVFGSEEYSEQPWYNDVFGCFITGPNPMGGQYSSENIAIVPGTTNICVSIYNINNGSAPPGSIPTGPCMNCQYYDDNTDGLYLQYDGLTTVLYAWLIVVPNELYHIKFGVADASDNFKDSGVFLEENGFCSPIHLNILSFEFPEIINPTLLNNYAGIISDDTINVAIPITEYSNEMIASYEAEIGAEVYVNGVLQQSGITSNNFDDPVVYTVVRFNSVKEYVVIVELIVNDENDILYYAFESENNPQLYQDYVAEITNTSISVDIPMIINPENLVASFVISDYAETYVNGVMQVNGITPNDFTSLVNYDVHAENGDTKNYSVQVSYELNSANDILLFDFDPALNPGIEGYAIGIIGENMVDLYLPNGTDVSNLIATFDLPVQARAYLFGQLQVSGVTPNNFTTPKLYNIEAGDGSVKDWLIIVHLITGVAEAGMKAITVYPNPADDRLIIRNAAYTHLKIYSMLGVLFSETEIKSESHSEDITLLPQGIYYLQIEERIRTEVRKIIVSH